jgi:ABC-type spermidine/putrescine transport system permease subunit II
MEMSVELVVAVENKVVEVVAVLVVLVVLVETLSEVLVEAARHLTSHQWETLRRIVVHS